MLKSPIRLFAAILATGLGVSACAGGGAPASAQVAPGPAPTYADLAGLAEAAPLIVQVEIRSQAVLPPERAPGVKPGMVRVYFESDTLNLIKGRSAVGERFAFLADVPLGQNGKPAKYKKAQWLLFARPVPGSADQLQLVTPTAYLPADMATVERVRTIAGQLVSPDAPPVVTGVGEAISVAGNLAGESETQIFLQTRGDAPVSITVVRRPGMAPQWGVSWSEIVDQAAQPPRRDTLQWYRLACFLPQTLPAEAFLQGDPAGQRMAQADYALVIEQLGPCERNLGG